MLGTGTGTETRSTVVEHLNLHKGARPDERFFLTPVCPVPKTWSFWKLIRRTSWDPIVMPDGTPGKWISWWFFNHLQWYHGTAKIDGTRTYMYRYGQLGAPFDPLSVVMTTTPSELLAFRWRTEPPKAPKWDDMGGT